MSQLTFYEQSQDPKFDLFHFIKNEIINKYYKDRKLDGIYGEPEYYHSVINKVFSELDGIVNKEKFDSFIKKGVVLPQKTYEDDDGQLRKTSGKSLFKEQWPILKKKHYIYVKDGNYIEPYWVENYWETDSEAYKKLGFSAAQTKFHDRLYQRFIGESKRKLPDYEDVVNADGSWKGNFSDGGTIEFEDGGIIYDRAIWWL